MQALEECNFSALPSTSAHRLAYIKKYANFLSLDEKKVLNKFTKDEGLENVKTNILVGKQKNLTIGSLFVLARNIFIILALISFFSYAIWQIRGVLRPPTLVVYSPPEGFVTASLGVIVEGYTDKETRVTVNGQEIMVGENGRFSTNIDLSKGINTINIVANKKHGKTTIITRNIIARD